MKRVFARVRYTTSSKSQPFHCRCFSKVGKSTEALFGFDNVFSAFSLKETLSKRFRSRCQTIPCFNLIAPNDIESCGRSWTSMSSLKEDIYIYKVAAISSIN